MTQIKAEIVADSCNPLWEGVNDDVNRIVTFALTYPRFIHSELLTHRVFSRNAASSRAIPIQKVMQQVQTDPAKPIRFGSNGKGMQDHGELTTEQSARALAEWKDGAVASAVLARRLEDIGVHKQISNRVMEPYVWMKTVVTTTDVKNFCMLRVDKHAQPEFQRLAYLMMRAYVDHAPTVLDWGEWHTPFGDRMPASYIKDDAELPVTPADRVKIATTRCARISYNNFDGTIDVAADLAKHDELLKYRHMSPFEHCAQANRVTSNNGNFSPRWAQYRKIVEATLPTVHIDIVEWLKNYEKSGA